MIAMTLTDMTFDDRVRLSQLRNERLRSLFAQSLLHCTFHRDHKKVLIIHCSETWLIDRLLADAEELCNYAWLILGVEAISLYFAKEEICRVEHGRVHYASSSIRHSILKRRGGNASKLAAKGIPTLSSQRYQYVEHK
jgi:hypothetical protein